MSYHPRRFSTFEAALKYPERLNLLFSPFRAKALNPEHYVEKLKFWTRAIEEYVVTDGKITFTILQLQTVFKTAEGKRPACLVEVINNLLRENIVVPREEWVQSLSTQNTWLSWGMRPVKWTFTKMLSYTPVAVTYAKREIDPETPLVHLSQLLSHEEKVLNISSIQNKVLSLEEWRKEVSSVIHAPEDLDLMIERLKSNGSLLTDHIGHVEVVKLISPNVGRRLDISQAEKSQYDISRTIQILESDLTDVLEKQEQAENLARAALKEGKRTTAKQHLRTKKISERRAAKLNEVLDNLITISNQIEDSASDALVVSAYEAGKKALTKQLKDSNLSTNRVTETMLDLQEVLENYDEVSAGLSQPVILEDVAEIEAELAMLLEEDKSKTARKSDGVQDALRLLDNIDMESLDPLKHKKPGRNLASGIY